MNKMELYKMVSLGDISISHKDKYDYFVVAGGSDYRAYEVLRKCYQYGVDIKNVIFVDFNERRENPEITAKISYDSYSTIKYKYNNLPCSALDPTACIKSLNKYGITIKSTDRLAIDISCFTKPYFFALLKYFNDILKINNVVVYYTEPMSYVFKGGLYNSYKSSIGPLSVMEIPGFPGDDKGKDIKILVILLGFEGDLSIHINEDVAPDRTIIVNGFPGYSQKFKDISLINNERIRSVSNSVWYARANNPFETFNLIDEISRKYDKAFINIAPIGTKPMALGACLYAIRHPSVRVVYPLPGKFENITTDLNWWSWCYHLSLQA